MPAESLAIVLPDHELIILQFALDVIDSLGAKIDLVNFVDMIIQFHGYYWDETIKTYIRDLNYNEDGTQIEKYNLVFNFFKGLENKRTKTHLEPLGIPVHEMALVVFVFNFATENGNSVNPATYIDRIADKYKFIWNEEAQQYISA